MNLASMVSDLTSKGITQEEIGKAIGRSQSTVSDIANGLAKRPTYQTVERLRKFHQQKMREPKVAA